MFDFQKFPYYVFILSRLFFHEAIHLLLNLSASLSLLKVSLAEMPLLLLLLFVLKNGKYSSQSFFMLMVHGMLHLFKYSHYDKNNRETMRMLENICMINLGLKATHET